MTAHMPINPSSVARQALTCGATHKSVVAKLTTSTLNLEELYKDGTPIAFKREIEVAQPDEQARLEAIRAGWIDPFYSLVNISDSRISAQFLNPKEDVTVETRENILQVQFDQSDLDFVLAAQDGAPLGLIIGTPSTELRKTTLVENGYVVLVAKMPERGVYEAFAVAPSGLYAFIASQPI